MFYSHESKPFVYVHEELISLTRLNAVLTSPEHGVATIWYVISIESIVASYLTLRQASRNSGLEVYC